MSIKKKRVRIVLAVLLCSLAAAFSGCSGKREEQARQPEEKTVATEKEYTVEEYIEDTEAKEEAVREEPEEQPSHIVVIDPGHQRHANTEPEPVGPGAQETKSKVTGGAVGCVTGLNEYELNLIVSMKLKDKLEDRGYQVIMTRTENDVDISNAQRAAVANEAGADAFIRIHANDIEDSSHSGAMTICQTEDNPYNGELYKESRRLSDCILSELTAAAGCEKDYVWETDTMSGINWCTVPVTIVEMGYLSNPEEDARMATDSYQEKLAEGIANGVDAFFAG